MRTLLFVTIIAVMLFSSPVDSLSKSSETVKVIYNKNDNTYLLLYDTTDSLPSSYVIDKNSKRVGETQNWAIAEIITYNQAHKISEARLKLFMESAHVSCVNLGQKIKLKSINIEHSYVWKNFLIYKNFSNYNTYAYRTGPESIKIYDKPVTGSRIAWWYNALIIILIVSLIKYIRDLLIRKDQKFSYVYFALTMILCLATSLIEVPPYSWVFGVILFMLFLTNVFNPVLSKAVEVVLLSKKFMNGLNLILTALIVTLSFIKF